MNNLVFFLEELSAKDLLQGLLPHILPSEINVKFVVFEGKQDLEKQIARKLKAWLDPDAVFVILRDQDAAPCTEVKQRLVDLSRQARRDNVLVRVACHELESWVLGDWEAIAEAFDRPKLIRQQNKAKYRDPDQMSNPVAELRRFIPDYQKRSGARLVGPLLRPERNYSPSFRVFCSGVRRLVVK
jgi:hypothetical protein